MRIAIVEDDAQYVDQLQGFLKRFSEEKQVKISVSVFTDGDEIALNYKAEFDLILMDIEMTFMDGMLAAETIRQYDSEVVIIFITNAPQYAIRGYAVDALDYVLKPISYYAFSQRIQRAISRMKKRTPQTITIAVKGGRRRLSIADIYYVEVRDHDLIYYTSQGEVLSSGTMRDTEELLSASGFFRCNKCYLINLDRVESVQDSDALLGGYTVPISRARKKSFLDALNNHLNEVSK